MFVYTRTITYGTSNVAYILQIHGRSTCWLYIYNYITNTGEPCAFDLLVYADKEATVPISWEDSDPCLIANAEEVRLRAFSTKVMNIL